MNGNYLQELNQAQRQAVEDIKGPSLIIAGAGSGKTKVLTCRIAYMLQQGIAPSGILALTFTNKAAKEMKERVGLLVGSSAVRYLWMGTFHSVFARILRSESERIGFPKTFTIYDKTDSKSAVKSCIKELQLDDKTYPVNEVAARISKAKNNLCTATAYAQDANVRQADEAAGRARITDIYSLYAKKCKLAGAMDFDDLLLYTNVLFSRFPEVLARYREQFPYILVDEYQDTNLAQYLIIKNLALEHRNIAVVGDDAQSIYAFRGARIENILNFSKDFPEAKEYRLEQNYRSTQTVVDAANSLIKHNIRRMPKECFSRAEVGDKIELLSAYTDAEEAFMVVSSISSRIYTSGASYGEFAILYRTNAQSRILEEALRKRNMPYRVYGGFSFYERAEVKDMMAYLRLIVNEKDDEAFKRVINEPARGIGPVSLQKLFAAAAFSELSAYEFIKKGNLEAAGLKGAVAQKLTAFVEMTEAAKAMQAQGSNAFEVAVSIAGMSGYLHALKQDTSLEGVSKLNNVEELLNSIQVFCGIAGEDVVELETEVSIPEEGLENPTLERFLANVALLSQTDEQDGQDAEKVSLMTVHSAKGLEFPYVYVVGMEEQLFPSLLSSNTITELEEERRLFYVAMTRAKKGLTLSFAHTRMRWGKTGSNPPSRFLREIDNRFLNRPVPDPGARDQDEDSLSVMWDHTGSRFGRSGTGRTNNSFWEKSDRRGNGDRGALHREAPQPPVEPLKPGFSKPSAGRSSASPAEFKVEDPSLLREGMEVEHDRFGRGRILKLEGESSNSKAVIEFEFGGCKTLLLKFAKLRKI